MIRRTALLCNAGVEGRCWFWSAGAESPVGQKQEEVVDCDTAVVVEIFGAVVGAGSPSGEDLEEIIDVDDSGLVEVGGEEGSALVEEAGDVGAS